MDREDFSLSRRARLLEGLRRYSRRRWKDVVGSVPFSVRWTGFLLRLDTTEARPTSPPTATVGDPREARAPERWPAAAAGRRRERYAAEARLARALLIGVGVSVAVFLHRAWLFDGAGAAASLGTGFMLARFALPPAFRCWRARTRTPASLRDFLRRPTVWWPPPLSDDLPGF